jgi:hypothetical protein
VQLPGLVRASPDTDLRLELSSASPHAALGEPWALTARVTNSGPADAIDPTLELTIPSANLALDSVDPGPGASVVETNTFLLRCRWSGVLAPGASRAARLVFRPLAPGPFVVTARAAFLGMDLDYSNNTASLESQTTYVLGANNSQMVGLATADLVLEPTRSVFYAAVPDYSSADANRIVMIDPQTGLISEVAVATNATRLAISDDGQYLYAAVDNGQAIQRLHLPDMTADLQFRLGDDPPYGPLVAERLQVVPQRPEALVVARLQPGLSPPDRGIALYVNGTMLPATTQDGSAFTLDSTGTNLYLAGAYYDHWLVTPDGFTNASRYFGFHVGANMSLAGPLLFTDSGDVLDVAQERVRGAFPVYGPKVPDLPNDRTYVLAGTEIAAYDFPAFTKLATTTLPPYTGTPGRLWRWGTDGFAFRTDAGQLVFLRSELVPTGTPADLALDVRIEASPANPTNKLVTFLLTNRGPGDARNITLQAHASTDITVREILSAPGGSAEIGAWPNDLTGRLPLLAAGATATFTARVEETTAWRAWSMGGLAVPANPDPNLNDNYGVAFVANPPPQPTTPDYQIPWQAQDMVYDRWHRRLVMTVPALAGVRGGCLLRVDPLTFQVDPPLVVGQNPIRIALTDDETRLYLSVDGSRDVRRINLNTQTLEAVFPLGPMEVAADLQAVPGFPRAMAVSRRDTTSVPGTAGVTVFDLPGGGSVQAADVPLVLAAGLVPGQLIGYNGSTLSSYTVSGFGIALTGSGGLVEGVTDIHSAAGRVFTDNGRVFDSSLTQLYQFPLYSYDVVTLPDPASGLVFRLQWNTIMVHRFSDFSDVASQTTSGASARAGVVRWVASGLAYLGSGYPCVVPAVAGLPADADQDGIPDAWETQYQLDPQSRTDASADADADGASNFAEFVAGTNPRDAASVLHLTLSPVGTELELTWPTALGRQYRLQHADSLTPGTWTDLMTADGNQPTAGYRIPASGLTGSGYYRVLVAW